MGKRPANTALHKHVNDRRVLARENAAAGRLLLLRALPDELDPIDKAQALREGLFTAALPLRDPQSDLLYMRSIFGESLWASWGANAKQSKPTFV